MTTLAFVRCDREQAEAAVILLRVGKHDLAFCAHHYREHVHALSKLDAERVESVDDFDTSTGFLVPVQPGASEPVPDTIPHGFTAEAPSGL